MLKSILVKLLCACFAAGCIACSSGLTIHKSTTLSPGPLRILPTNPRYFTDGSGRAVYLTGSHHWWNLQDAGTSSAPPVFDFPAYLNFLEHYNHNFIRLWAHEQARWNPSTTGEFYVEMSPFRRSSLELALDGKPKFDVDNFNQAYFDRLRARVVAAGARGIYVSIMLFNGWSVEPFEETNFLGNPWPGHPFHRQNNINGIDGDINNDNQGQEIHTMSTDPRLLAVRTRQEAYIRQIIDTVNDLDNVLYEIGNEILEASTEWQYHMIRYIKEYEVGKPKQHPVGMTYQGTQGGIPPNNATLFTSPADWISPGPIESVGAAYSRQYQKNPPAADGRKVILTDTDHLWGIGGEKTWVWKSFTRGLNPIYMDPYGGQYGGSTLSHADESARRAMGDTLMYATRINLAASVPMPELSSTGYCLAHPGREYLIYVPPRGQALGSLSAESNEPVRVDLSASSDAFRIEWFHPETGKAIAGGIVKGGGQRTLIPPFDGDAVLYLVADGVQRTEGHPSMRSLVWSMPSPRKGLTKWPTQ